MSHPYHHALSSVKKFGGKPEDYQSVHDFMDSSKAAWADIRHRAILHNTFGIFLAEKIFGTTIKRQSDGKEIPTRLICEQHVIEDCGKIPTIEEWLDNLPKKDWMIRGAKPLSQTGD